MAVGRVAGVDDSKLGWPSNVAEGAAAVAGSRPDAIYSNIQVGLVWNIVIIVYGNRFSTTY